MPRPALVMIHGLVGSLDYFGPETLLRHAQPSTPALLGYGERRDAAPHILTLEGQAEHVAAHIRELTSEPVWLLGHSMGGAIAMLLAARQPELVCGLINVEGNFTLKDAFWSSRVVAQGPDEWEREYRGMLSGVRVWLVACGVAPNPRRVRWAEQILACQPASTVYAMSRAIVEETRDPDFMQAVQAVVDGGPPIHLIAGERSAAAWDVPDFVRRAARSYTEQPDAGHLMMLEAPDAFCRIVDECLHTRVA